MKNLKKSVFIALGVLLSAEAAHASDACGKVSESGLAGIEALGTSMVRSARGSASQLSPLARDAAGRVILMVQPQAEQYCRARGMRLPRANEVARALNPDGMVTLPISAPLTIHHEGVRSPQGRVAFFNDSRTYQPQTDKDGRFAIWTASVLPREGKVAYVFNGATGEFDIAQQSVNRLESQADEGRPSQTPIGVRCIANR